MALQQLLELVNDRKSFFAFVQALIDDRETAIGQETLSSSSPYNLDAEGWKHTTIKRYLNAA